MSFRYLILTLLLLFFFSELKSKEHKENFTKSPKEPSVPEVQNSQIDNFQKKISVVVKFADNIQKDGFIKFDSEQITFLISSTGQNKFRNELLSNINFIQFLKWKGKEFKHESYVFYPSLIKIVLMDGKTFECKQHIAELNKLFFEDSTGLKFYYSYFYDYWKMGKWINSGKKNFNHPQTHPPRKVITKITFKKDKQELDLIKLLKRAF